MNCYRSWVERDGSDSRPRSVAVNTSSRQSGIVRMGVGVGSVKET
jgi:hypothetical protein